MALNTYTAKWILCAICLGLIGAFVVSCTPGTANPSVTKAEETVDALAWGKYQLVTKDFNSTMKASVSEEQLARMWRDAVAQTGVFKSRGTGRAAHEQGFQVVYVPCKFEKTAMEIKVVFDSDGKIAGLWIVQPQQR